jgi:phosphoethanolamine N-methyltransferase
MEILQTELKRFHEKKQEFLNKFSQADFNYIVEGWKSKVERCSSGDQAWGLFVASKPL